MDTQTKKKSYMPITGIVLTYNGERTLDNCLQSLNFCSRIFVVDSFSTDKTLEIVKCHTSDYVQNPWDGPVNQFNFALSNVTTEWVITIDQDEICSQALQDSVKTNLVNVPDTICGFYVPRRSWYYDKFLKHSGWYPDYLLRIFRPNKIYFSQNGAHEKINPKGNTQKLQGDILHYPYESFYNHVEKINTYAQEGSYELVQKNTESSICLALLHGIGRFIKIFIIKKGFLDGKAGFINAVHGAFYAFSKYIRINEGSWGAPYDHK